MGGKVYRFTQKAKLEDLIRLIVENDISSEQLEEIAGDMVRFGDSAVRPLLRELDRAKEEDSFFRLTYVIECLQNASFVGPLLKMILTRKLPHAFRAQVLNVLNHFDVDISETLLGGVSGDLKVMTESFVDLTIRDENLLESFLEEFLYLGFDLQLNIIRRIASIKSNRSVFILFIIGSMFGSPIALHAARELGRIRDGMALSALRRLVKRTRSAEVKRQAVHSLRRLELLGVKKERRFYRFPQGPLYRVIVSRIDGMDEFTVTLSRFYDERKLSLAMSIFQINRSFGIVECYGNFKTSKRAFDSIVAGFLRSRSSLAVPPAYGLSLIRNGMFLTEKNEGIFPAEMPLREQILDAEEIYPHEHRYQIRGYQWDDIRDNLALLEKTEHLVLLPECSEWILTSKRTFEYAEELLKEPSPEASFMDNPKKRNLLKQYTRECLHPLRKVIRERLLFSAELMQQGGRSGKHVKTALCAALNIGEEGNVSFTHHPFVEALARESLKEAVEYLKEGADYRGLFYEFGDEE
jgi:hypothetical protein